MHGKPKPEPGSLPLKTKQREHDHIHEQAQSALPSWMKEEPPPPPPKPRVARPATALQLARKKAMEAAGELQDDVFADWVRRCVETAQDPREWTQARLLHESYVRHARAYGSNRTAKRLAVETLASETQWGRMMATLFTKRRRGSGWHYPLRLKRGA